ncbi:MAG: hypothetical protein V3V02_07830 [Rhizobiaceae bacterium]
MLLHLKQLTAAIIISAISYIQVGTAAPLTAQQQSCGVITALTKGIEVSIPHIEQLLQSLGKEKVDTISPQLTKLFKNVKFKGGRVYDIGSLGNDMSEHMLVVERANRPAVYFRFIYHKLAENMQIVEFSYQPTFKAIIKRNHLSPPVELPCS